MEERESNFRDGTSIGHYPPPKCAQGREGVGLGIRVQNNLELDGIFSEKKTHSSSPATHLPIPKKLPSDSQYHKPAELLKEHDHTRARTHTQHHSLTFRMMRQCCKFRQCESHPEPHLEDTHRRLGTHAGGAQQPRTRYQPKRRLPRPWLGAPRIEGGGERSPPGKRGESDTHISPEAPGREGVSIHSQPGDSAPSSPAEQDANAG